MFGWLQAYLYAETRQPVIWTGKNEYGRVEIWVDGLKKMKEQKKVFQNHIDIVSYVLKVSINCVTCVFVVLFRSKNTFKVCELA